MQNTNSIPVIFRGCTIAPCWGAITNTGIYDIQIVDCTFHCNEETEMVARPTVQVAEMVHRKTFPELSLFDPSVILVIIQIIEELLPLIIELCNLEPENVPKVAENVTGLRYMVWRNRAIRAVGRRPFREAGGDAMFRNLIEATVELEGAVVREIHDSIVNRP